MVENWILLCNFELDSFDHSLIIDEDVEKKKIKNNKDDRRL